MNIDNCYQIYYFPSWFSEQRKMDFPRDEIYFQRPFIVNIENRKRKTIILETE